ncbi:DUF1749 domain-containing protein [Patescibacteria group bacterium]
MEIVKAVTEDKIHLTGFLSEPKGSKDKIIVHIHGMSGDPYTNSWYPYFHNLFPENNIAFLVGNHRGTGSITMFFQEPDKYPNYGNAFEVFENCVFDIDAWVNYALDLGYKNVTLQAHSMGPSKAIYYLNKKKHPEIKKLVLTSPVDMLGLANTEKNFSKMESEAKELINQNKGDQLLSNLIYDDYLISAQTFLNLFQEDSNCNVFCYQDREHNWKMVNSVKVPVFLIGGTKDWGIETNIKTDKAFEILKKEFKNSPSVKTKIYNGASHDFGGFEEQITKDIIGFVLK